MTIKPNEDSIQQLRHFFMSKFVAPSATNQVAEDVWQALESPIFKEHIFASSFLAVIDHATMRYRYVSSSAKDFTGYESSELMENGVSFFMSSSDDVATLLPVYEKVAALVMALPRDQRMHVHLYYDFHINTPLGRISLYQQTIPLALNDEGYPYLMLAVVSNITEFKTDRAIHYRATLNLPDQPISVLISGNSNQSASPLSKRENEIVQRLADGHDSDVIADKLFISPDTVRTHRKNILEKTGARNTVHLVRMAVANGWI